MVYRRTWMILFSGFFEPLFYLFFFVYPLGRRDRGRRLRPGDTRVRRVRRAGAARGLGDERRVLRRDERLLEAALREGLRRDALDPGEPGRRRGGRDDVGRRAVAASTRRRSSTSSSSSASSSRGGACSILPACFVIGFGFAGAGIAAVTWMRELAGLRPDPARHAADVPLRDDVLPDLRLPGGDRVDRAARCRSTTASSSSARSRPERSAPSSSSTSRISLTMGVVGMFIASRRIDGLLLEVGRGLPRPTERSRRRSAADRPLRPFGPTQLTPPK